MALESTVLEPDGRVRLTRDRLFVRLWIVRTIGDLRFTIDDLALSLTAVVVLSAGAAEMGALTAARTLPYLGAGLLAGVLADRISRASLLVATSLGATALLLLVPLAAAVGALRMEVLYVVAVGVGAMTLAANVAQGALLPVLAGRDRLVEGNTLLQASGSAVMIAGPSLGGLLIQWVTAPLALLVSAGASLISAIVAASIRGAEPPPTPRPRSSLWREIREGMQIVLSDPVLRPIILTGAIHNVFSNGMLMAIYVLFASSTLGLSAAEIGLVFAAGGPGAIAGTALAAPMARRIGVGPTLGLVQVITGIARLAVPLAILADRPAVALAAGELLLGVARPIFNVHQLSLRQALVPDHQMGRTTATIGFIMWGAVPIGALIGGWAGSEIGLIPTLGIAVAGTFGASLCIYLSPVRTMRDAPPPIA